LTSVEERIAELRNLGAEGQLFHALPPIIYLDANSIVDLIRIGRFGDVLDIVPPYQGQPRFRVMKEVESEVVGVYVGKRFGTDQYVRNQLKHPNLIVEDPEIDEDIAGQIATMRKRIADRSRVDAADYKDHRKKHLGEAASIVYGSKVNPPSAFVSDDEIAITFAYNELPNLFPLRSRVLLGGLLANGTDPLELWQNICDTRQCQVDVSSCWSDLKCPALSGNARKKGAYPREAESLSIMLEKTCIDIATLKGHLERAQM